MKWQGYNNKAAEKVNGLVAKVVSNRTGYILVTLAALIVVAAASNKWGG